ncbi:MAG: hypothetical protein AAF840_02420, partial [Bacteroidota bacterium]
MSHLKDRINTISILEGAKRRQDVLAFKEIEWELKSEEQAYRLIILRFYNEIESVLGMVESVTITSGAEFQQTWYSMANAHLDAVEMVLRRDSTVETRLAQLEGFKLAIEEHNNQFQALAGSTALEVSEQLKTLAT